ncbi:hypothetical protein E2C01_058629 [Portunus trituberculatus]|uniref:Uncharacterized protein n=1 Tax=Portunus trituberculatus TaxID=210409 RepID=A0A5B7H0C6_PORTR|nr:hypothetical protein [Portunus trituberculatus]
MVSYITRVSGADVTKDRFSPPTSQAALSFPSWPSHPSWHFLLVPLPIQLFSGSVGDAARGGECPQPTRLLEQRRENLTPF